MNERRVPTRLEIKSLSFSLSLSAAEVWKGESCRDRRDSSDKKEKRGEERAGFSARSRYYGEIGGFSG